MNGPARAFVQDVFSTQRALSRELVDNLKVIAKLSKESKFGRNIWGLLCLELWQQEFHDKAAEFKQFASDPVVEVTP